MQKKISKEISNIQNEIFSNFIEHRRPAVKPI